jgi:hypothetical protein
MRVTERPRRSRFSTWIVVAAAVLVGLFLIGQLSLFDFIPNPFQKSTTDRSQPAILEKLSDISEYHAATAELQVLVDVENSIDFVPGFIAGERVTFLAGGSVDAIVDFGDLGSDAVKVDGDSVTITLPAATVGKVTIDPDRSYVVNRDRGILDRIGGIFVDNPTGEQKLYQLAEDKLRAAADDSAVTARGQKNTERMLKALLGALGFEHVTVVFEEPPKT